VPEPGGLIAAVVVADQVIEDVEGQGDGQQHTQLHQRAGQVPPGAGSVDRDGQRARYQHGGPDSEKGDHDQQDHQGPVLAQTLLEHAGTRCPQGIGGQLGPQEATQSASRPYRSHRL
jgi:hypothetical protein